MCLSDLENRFDLDYDVFYLKSRKILGFSLFQFGVHLCHQNELKYGCDYYVFRLNLKCDDDHTKVLIKGLMN